MTLARASVAIGVVIVVLFAAWRFALRDDGHEYTLIFQNAGQLVKGDNVQIGGRPVGSVKSISLTSNNLAAVKVSVQEPYAPLHAGTEAVIRLTSLSGIANRYVALSPGPGTNEALGDGATLDTSQTTTAVDLDQLFNSLDPKARKDLQGLIKGFSTQYEGKALQAADSTKYFNPLLSSARQLVNQATADEGDLTRFLVSSSRTVTTIADKRDDDLALLVDRLAVTFGAIAKERTSLTRAVGALAPFMRRANSTFVNLRSTLDDLDPLVEESIPVTPKLAAVLDQLRPFARDATPTFRNLSLLVKRPGEANDLTNLAQSTLPFRDVTTRPGTYNGKQREGSFAAARRSLKAQTPQFAFQRPYAVDLTGWFDDFSHSGVYDANGSASRVSTTVSAFAFLNGTLKPVPENMRGQVLSEVATLGQRNRCPGSTERPAPDGSNPYRPSPDFNCDPSQIPPGP